jgi:DnaK suppressor protein
LAFCLKYGQEALVPVDLNSLRTRLEEERLHLAQQLVLLEAGQNTAEEKRESTPFGKRDQGAADTLELEKRLALKKGIESQIAEIEITLARIREGKYGFCERCGLPIDPARLEVMPTASLCMKCKVQSRIR